MTQRAPLREGWLERMLSETDFMRRYPHYAGVLARMDVVQSNLVSVMAVGLRRWDDPGSRLLLMVNPEYLEHHPEFRAGVLLHEIQHAVLGHITDTKFHAVRYPRLMEIAMELSADEGIAEPLPPNGIEMELFESYGIREGQSTLERYKLLADAYDRGDLCLQDFWLVKNWDTHRPRQCGGAGIGIGDLIDARSDGASERNWNGNPWGLGAPTGAHAIERMKRRIAEHLRGERGGADDFRDGTQRRVAKELDRLVYDSGDHARIDWLSVLRQAFPQHRQVRPDYKRPNRRFPARVGEIPGRTRRPPKPALLVAVDTSGSMTGESLDRIAQEIRRLSRHGRLTIIECDAAVHRVYPFTNALGPFTGGGDTDFGPVFDDTLLHQHYQGLVYFTDGKGEMPSTLPAIPTLWAISHEDPFSADFGTVVRLPNAST